MPTHTDLIEEYNERQRRRKKVDDILFGIACVALILVSGFLIWIATP